MWHLDLDAALLGGRQRTGVRLEVERGRILAAAPSTGPARGLAALPGFCNVHVHLDLTFLHGEDLSHGSFADWIRSLVAGRREADAERLRQAVREGAEELLRTGTVAVGDIDSTGVSLDVLRETALEGLCYREVLGSSPQELLERVVAEAADPSRPRIRRGVSPHAPYSTPEATYRDLFQKASRQDLWLTSHVGETQEERVLLQENRGPLRTLFEEWGFQRPHWSQPGAGPTARVLQLAPPGRRFLAVHANYLEPAEEAALVRAGAGLAYCPRSHEYFGHPQPHPAGRLLRQGVAVGLGTDSRASNHGLDLWQELLCWHRSDPSVDDEKKFAAATAVGRQLLGLPPADLEPGQAATFQVVRRRDGGPTFDGGLVALAVTGQLDTVATVIDGVVVWGEPQD